MDNNFDYENEIVEITNDDDKTTKENTEETSNLEKDELVEEKVVEKKPKRKKNKKSIKDLWLGFSKKQRIIAISVASGIVLLLIILILCLTVFKGKKDNPKDEEQIIVEKDNYRYENGKLVFLDKSDKEIGSYECENKDAEKCLTLKADYSSDKFERIKSVYEDDTELPKSSKIYFDKYVFITDGDKNFLYNMVDSEKVLDVKSIKYYDTDKNLVVIEDENNKYGLIDIKESEFEYLIRPTFDNLGIINSKLSLLSAEDKDTKYLVDTTGKKLSKNISGDMASANDKYIVVTKNNSYNLYDYNNEELLSDYSYISLFESVVTLVKGNRLFLRDSSLNKLYQEGIRLESSDYVKKHVYDSNNKLITTKKAYDLEINNDVVNVTIDGNTKNINMLDGAVSANLAYMNYFDGKLYFYSDVEKDDLIGTYECANKNVITSSTSKLGNCNLYSTNKGISGIYNNDYVIIFDNNVEINNDNKYILYSLKEKKAKATYSSIELVNENELSDNVKPVYTSSSYIIAKAHTGANKGNYGVLEINSNKVAPKVEFKYESITKDKGYYLLINIDKSYSIYDSVFKKASNEFNYIKLYDNYYVGIKDNKLNVYSYANALGILEKDLEVKDNKYEIDFTDGFKVTIDGKEYKYDISGKIIEDNENGA